MSNQQRIRFLQRRWSSPVGANLRICGELGRLVRRELRRGRGRLRLRRDDVALLSSDLEGEPASRKDARTAWLPAQKHAKAVHRRCRE